MSAQRNFDAYYKTLDAIFLLWPQRLARNVAYHEAVHAQLRTGPRLIVERKREPVPPELSDAGSLHARAAQRVAAESIGLCGYCFGAKVVKRRGAGIMRFWSWLPVYKRCNACGGSGRTVK